jgi:hypothetical protein
MTCFRVGKREADGWNRDGGGGKLTHTTAKACLCLFYLKRRNVFLC